MHELDIILWYFSKNTTNCGQILLIRIMVCASNGEANIFDPLAFIHSLTNRSSSTCVPVDQCCSRFVSFLHSPICLALFIQRNIKMVNFR